MDFFSNNPDKESYHYRIMECVEGMPWNENPKDELRYKHLNNDLHLFMIFLGPTYHFCKSPIQAPYKLCKVQGVHDAHYKLHFGRRLGEETLHN